MRLKKPKLRSMAHVSLFEYNFCSSRNSLRFTLPFQYEGRVINATGDRPYNFNFKGVYSLKASEDRTNHNSVWETPRVLLNPLNGRPYQPPVCGVN